MPASSNILRSLGMIIESGLGCILRSLPDDLNSPLLGSNNSEAMTV